MSVLDLDDIQGNILAGFNTRFQAVIGLTVPNRLLAAARWVATLADRVTTVAMVERERAAMRANEARAWLAVAISRRLVEAVHPGVVFREKPFRRGMAIAAAAIGDRTDPTTWFVGTPSAPVDVLLVVAANEEAATSAVADDLVASASREGLAAAYRELGTRLELEREHFGFRDGLSQPRIRDYDAADAELFAGNVVFGHPRKAGAGNYVPADDPIGLLQNGSFLAFRRLVQDVAAFRAFCASEAERIVGAWPGMTATRLAALIVGRWPSGVPVSTAVAADPGGEVLDNSFTFADDLLGQRCPLGAHIRKVNPRRGNIDVVDLPRIVRRGIPFGPTYDTAPDAERGLLFMSYQTSIVEQFEFLASAWMNDPNRPLAGSGHDVLVGRTFAARSISLAGPNGPVVVTDGGHQWIKPTGGAYLFAPGRAALAMLATPTPVTAALALEGHQWIKPTGGAYLFAPGGAVLATPTPVTAALALEELALGEAPPRIPRDGVVVHRVVVGRSEPISARWTLTRPVRRDVAGLASLNTLERLELSGEHFATDTLDGVEMRELATFRTVRELALDGTALRGHEVIAVLARLPRLRAVDVRGLDLDDAEVRALTTLRADLDELSVGLAELGREGHRFEVGRLTAGLWDALTPLQRPRVLRVRGVPLDDRAILRTPRILDAVETLDLGETAIGDATAGYLAGLPRLRRLACDWTRLGDAGAIALAGAKLTELDVSNSAVRVEGTRALLSSGLERLALAGLRLPGEPLLSLERETGLRALDLRRNGVDDQIIARLQNMPRLEDLALDHTYITKRGVAELANTALRTLSLRGIVLDTAALRRLADLPALTRVSLELAADWEGLEAITASLHLRALPPARPSPSTALVELDLNGALNEPLLGALSALPRLERLYLRAGADLLAAISDDGFGALRRLVCERAGLDDVALEAIARRAPLEELMISGNSVGIAISRLRLPFLHTLEVRDTGADDVSVEAIVALPRLHCLDIPNTRITADGAAAIIGRAPNLQSVALDGIQLTPTVVGAIARSSVCELYLYGPTVDDATIAGLAPLQELRDLVLVETATGDGIVPTIVALSGLRTLKGAELSADAHETLVRARPDLAVLG